MRIQTFNQRLETVVYNLINTTNNKQCIDEICSLRIVYGSECVFFLDLFLLPGDDYVNVMDEHASGNSIERLAVDRRLAIVHTVTDSMSSHFLGQHLGFDKKEVDS